MSAGYSATPDIYDEALASSPSKIHWQTLFKQLDNLGQDELRRRMKQSEQLVEENGVTYRAVLEDEVRQRPWKLDLVPMILDDETFKSIEEGISQRAQLLNLIIRDIYGPQDFIREGILAPETVYAHSGFLHGAVGLHEQKRSLLFYAAELARSKDGRFWVMADRSDAPAGAGFALENRIISKRTVPQLSQNLNIRTLAPFFITLKKTLRSLAPENISAPRIALLTGGSHQKFYFEDVYLARYLGYDLVQGSDLAVRDDHVYIKTLAGLLPVNVLLQRGNESGLDPLELGGGSSHGVPGLLNAIRRKNVSLVNIPGAGVIEAPVLMAQLPHLCKKILGESLKLPSIATWWCKDPEHRDYVIDHLDSLVVKPAFAASGSDEYIGAELSTKQIDELKEKILESPQSFVAQELISRSAAPMVGDDGQLHPGHVAMRVFAVANDDDYELMPGGLVRVSMNSGPMELSISGGETSKDLWVLNSESEKKVSLLPAEHCNVDLKRTGAMFPSRVADDLFWLGQSIERSDLIARMLRSMLARIEMVHEANESERSSLLQALVDVGALATDDKGNLASVDYSRILDSMNDHCQDASYSKGLAATISEMNRLSSLIRDWISPETWQQLHLAGVEYFASFQSSEKHSLSDVFDDLIVTLSSVMGLIDNGMVRSPAWRFLDIGRRIERARIMATFVASVVRSGSLSHPTTLKMVIEIIDCQMTYRARYLDDIQQNAVIDLCVTDDSNPRSILFQLEEISRHVDMLPSFSAAPLRNDEKRFVMSTIHKTRMLTSDELGEADPQKLLSVLVDVELSLKELANHLERKYLLHSGEPRQILSSLGTVS